jgi:hypothetical protein
VSARMSNPSSNTAAVTPCKCNRCVTIMLIVLLLRMVAITKCLSYLVFSMVNGFESRPISPESTQWFEHDRNRLGGRISRYVLRAGR